MTPPTPEQKVPATQGPVVEHLQKTLKNIVKVLQQEADRIVAKGGLHRQGKRPGTSIQVPVAFTVQVHYGGVGGEMRELHVRSKVDCVHAWSPGDEKCMGCGLSVAAIKAALPR